MAKVYVVKAYHTLHEDDSVGTELFGVVDSKEKALERIKKHANETEKSWADHNETGTLNEENPWRIELISPEVTITFCCEEFELE